MGILKLFLGGYQTAGPALMATGLELWTSPYYKLTNSTGFTGLPNGGIASVGESSIGFTELKVTGIWWSSSALGSWGSGAEIQSKDCFLNIDSNYYKFDGFGIRLIKDAQ